MADCFIVEWSNSYIELTLFIIKQALRYDKNPEPPWWLRVFIRSIRMNRSGVVELEGVEPSSKRGTNMLSSCVVST